MKKALYLMSSLFLMAAFLAPTFVAAAPLYDDPNGGFAPDSTGSFSNAGPSTYTSTAAAPSSGGVCSTLTTNGLTGVINCIIGIMNNIITLLIAASVVYVIYGAFQMIRSEEHRESGRQTVVYGIIGIFVMISVWGLVNILDRTFNLRGSYIPAPQLRPIGQ